jgi:hypothetical protein
MTLLPRPFVITLPAKPNRSDPSRVSRLLGAVSVLAVRATRSCRSSLRAPEARSPASLTSLQENWSVLVGAHYRALAVDAADGLIWFWIGSHADYDRLLG